jgi:hypothetical protein
VRIRSRRAPTFAVVLVAAAALAGCGAAGSAAVRRAPVADRASGPEACTGDTRRATRLAGPTRVLFMGDSIMGNVVVDGAGQRLFERRGFEVRRSANPGYGLLDDPQHGYSNQMALQVAGFDPDVVVLEFIGNDRAFGDPGLPGVAINTTAFYAAWQAEAENVTRLAAARGADVLWVLGPTVGISQEWVARVHAIADGYRRLAASSCATGDVDAFGVLGDPWVAGPWRSPDGVHLTAEGGAVLARAICDRVVERVGGAPDLRRTDRDAPRGC